jgi:PHD/YefM family antitoxin component YafN of YafNO toxin-antitoxin module
LKRTLNKEKNMGAKTITASNLRSNLAAALDSVSPRDLLIVTRRGKQEKAIVDLDKLEDLMAASDPKYLESIKTARQQYKNGEVFSLEEAFSRS